MGGVLRVNPDALREAARAEAEVSEFMSALAADRPIVSAGTGVSGLLSEGACRFAGSMVESALGAVHADLTAHSTKLSIAADRYHGTDTELGRGLREFAP